MKSNKPTPSTLQLNESIANLIQNLSDEKKRLLYELLIEWQQAEHRDDARIPCLIAVDFSTKTRAYRDFIQDLSRGGVFIETREPIQDGESISMTFSMPKSQTNFKFSGKVIHSENDGIGIQFDTKLSRYQEEIIKDSVKKK